MDKELFNYEQSSDYTSEMICPFCSKTIRSGTVFCRFCGKKIADYHNNFEMNSAYMPSSNEIGGKDVVSELRKYKKLLDDGLISQEDYQQIKSKILGI